MKNKLMLLGTVVAIGLSACQTNDTRQEATTVATAKPLPPPTPRYAFEEGNLYYQLPQGNQGTDEAKRFMAKQGFPLSKMMLYDALLSLNWAKADEKYRNFLAQNRQHRFTRLYRQYVSQIILKDLHLLAETGQEERIAFYTNEMIESGVVNPVLLSHALSKLTKVWEADKMSAIAKAALRDAAALRRELETVKQNQMQDKRFEGLDELRTNLLKGADKEIERIQQSEKTIAALISNNIASR
jgi:hypothetical protein